MPFDAVFNANEVKPQQSGGAHPVGNKFPFSITNTVVEPTKQGNGGKFVVELTSSAGSIRVNYNLWNESEQARNISKGQLSALCHAVGIFQVDFKNDGAALRGGVGLMDVGFQKGQEPSAEKPEGGYVEVKKIYDKNGNDPTQINATPQQQVSSGFTQQQQTPPNNNGGFGQQVSTQQPNTANGAGGWSSGGQQQQQQTQQQPDQTQQQTGGWQQGGTMPQTAPWQK